MSPDSASLSLCRSVLLALLCLERGFGPEPFALVGTMSSQGEAQLRLAVGLLACGCCLILGVQDPAPYISRAEVVSAVALQLGLGVSFGC